MAVAALALMLGAVCFAEAGRQDCRPNGNLVPNASFELGSVGWHVRTSRARMDPWTCAPVAYPAEGAWKGKSLRVDVPANGAIRISSERLTVEPGKKYFVSARVKAETPGRTSLGIACPKVNDWVSLATRGANISNVWQEISGVVTAAPNHHEAMFTVDWKQPGAFWIDDVVVAEETTSVRQQEGIESGFVLPDTYLPAGRHAVTFRAIDYEKSGSRTFLLTARHPATGWKQTREVTLELERGVAAEKEVEFDFDWYGEIELTASVRQQEETASVRQQEPATACCRTLVVSTPARLAILPTVAETLPKLGDEFSVGVNETGVFPPLGGWDQACQCPERSFAEHLALLKACGVQHIRAFNEDWSHLPVFNPERGVYDASRLDPWLDAMEAAGMPFYMTIKFILERRKDLDGWNHWSAPRTKAWYLFKESQPTGRASPTWPDRKIEWFPKVDDVAALCGALARHCKGRCGWYELFNEPNLDMCDAHDCVRYQKAVCEAMKREDPSCRLAGVCTTQDFGTDSAADFAGNCVKFGIAPYLDAISFHPYSAALDNGIKPAAEFLHAFREMVRPHPHVGLWNTECFYLLNRSDYTACRKTDPQFLRPQYLVRRTLIDLGEGVKVSSSLHVMQLFRPPYAEMTQHTGEHSGHKLVPTDAAVGLAAFAKLMTRARPVRSLEGELTDGLRGYLFTLADGRPCAVLWAFEDVRKFIVRTEADAYDMYGNLRSTRSWFGLVRDETDHLVDERPVYFVGEGDPDAFLKTLAIRPEKPVVVNGARRLRGNMVVVELLNLRDERTVARCNSYPVALAAKERRAVRLPVPAGTEDFDVVCETVGQTDTFRVHAEPTRKTAKSGERVTVGPLSFAVTLADEGVVVDAKTADDTRTVGTFQQPWTGDTIELFFDARPDTHLNEYRDAAGTFRLFVLPPTPDPVSAPGHRARALSTCTPKLDIGQIRQRIDENGKEFGCHLTIPWSYFGGRRLDAIGFDIIANDFDPATKTRTAAHVWSGDTANFETRFKWGRIEK